MIPAVTVLMPVHNAEPHLRAAVTSILAQTFRDLELLIVDDCSSDGSSAAVGPPWTANQLARQRAKQLARVQIEIDDVLTRFDLLHER